MSADGLRYLDSSALVKLVVIEPESASLRRFLASWPNRVSCAIARVEVMRHASRHGPPAIAAARRLLRDIDLVALDDEIIDQASLLQPVALRSLDAIHLAAALSLGSALGAVVTYDRRMREAAEALGLPVEAPA